MGPVKLEKVVFALNGRRHEVAGADVHPGTTLLEFIRTRTPFTGTKLGCGEDSRVEVLFLSYSHFPPFYHIAKNPVRQCLPMAD
ncbi:unnamed protein product [Triticum turgidum subsp. durum]|uniref:Aldehyde oxidase 4 n=1 Tax=Triticum turgidum subsp. durum TaxID=4567 RepID=A0A9R0ZPI9_TRITD|nr:unnamed protein product [Triticum turgidum subsp. durum]